MQFSELLSAVQKVVFDDTYTASIIKARINESIVRIATGVPLPGQSILSPALPSLYKSATVSTGLASGITSLPVDFNRNVVQVLNASNEIIPIEPSFKKFIAKHPGMGAGSVYTCCVYDDRLLYRDIPSISETLTIHYYSTPVTLVADFDVPSSIPASLHRKLIVAGTLMEIYRETELGMAGPKIDTEYYTGIFNAGLIELDELYPHDSVPDFYEDANSYID